MLAVRYLGHSAERKLLFSQGIAVKGLPYIGAAIFAAVIRRGACGGRSQPSLASSICWSFSGSVWRVKMNSRPSVVEMHIEQLHRGEFFQCLTHGESRRVRF
jgi:hypothetical protein